MGTKYEKSMSEHLVYLNNVHINLHKQVLIIKVV